MHDGWDRTWDQVFRRQEWGKYPAEYIIRFIAKTWYGAQDRTQIRFLDLGSGPGAHTWYLAREGFSVAAIDGSEAAIYKLKDRLKTENLKADVQKGDFISLPWRDGTFDGVIDNVSLCHNTLASGRTVLAEVKRVLKKTGMFLSTSFTDRCWGYGTGQQVEPGGFIDIAEGPCAGKGFCRFMNLRQAENFYSPFTHVELETLSWTLQQRTRLVEMWLAICK